jgi:hypothetical protein
MTFKGFSVDLQGGFPANRRSHPLFVDFQVELICPPAGLRILSADSYGEPGPLYNEPV